MSLSSSRAPLRVPPAPSGLGVRVGGVGATLVHLACARPAMSTDGLAIAAGIVFALVFNGAFWHAAMAGRGMADPQSWRFAAATVLALAALHTLLLALVLQRRIAKPLLGLLIAVSAPAAYFMQNYGIYLDPTMLRNVLRTDVHEARELLGWALLPWLLLSALPPALLLWRVRLVERPLWRACLGRVATIAGAALVLVLALLTVFADVSALLRNQHGLRYLITPANVVYSLARVTTADAQAAHGPPVPVGADAHLGPAWSAAQRPVLFVLVVGETARAANWGLNGSPRQTTPELAQTAGVLNFAHTTSCGTNTETSLPCMFSAVGRRAYDEKRIRGSESLLHVLAHAGLRVLWRDNQSGCKGVCRDLPQETVSSSRVPGLCAQGICLDEALLDGLDAVARDAGGNLFLVLHTIGNHGPAYFRRYPAAYRRFTPACESDELRRCSEAEIVNAYDNALLYTDHLLARTIGWLKAHPALDSALIYVSDHGESLGEHGLYLHGAPYAIAPAEQTEVPMLWWLSDGYRRRFRIDGACLARQAARPAAHDHLFHSVLGLLDVQTAVYERDLDIAAPCRGDALV